MFVRADQATAVLSGFVMPCVWGLCLSPTSPSVCSAFSNTSENNWLLFLVIFYVRFQKAREQPLATLTATCAAVALQGSSQLPERGGWGLVSWCPWQLGHLQGDCKEKH